MEPLHYLVQANLILTVLVLACALLLRRTTRFTLNRVVLWMIVFETVYLPVARLPTYPIYTSFNQFLDTLTERV